MSLYKKKIHKGKKGGVPKECAIENIAIVQNIVEDALDGCKAGVPNHSVVESVVEDVSDIANSMINKELSDDLLDALECDVHDLLAEPSLEEKMKKHKQLKETTNQLISEVDRLIELMQNTNQYEDLKEMNKRSSNLDQINEESGDHITSDIVANLMGEIETDVGQIVTIEHLNEQVRRYQTIMKKIGICKDFYCNGRIDLKNIN